MVLTVSGAWVGLALAANSSFPSSSTTASTTLLPSLATAVAMTSPATPARIGSEAFAHATAANVFARSLETFEGPQLGPLTPSTSSVRPSSPRATRPEVLGASSSVAVLAWPKERVMGEAAHKSAFAEGSNADMLGTLSLIAPTSVGT